MMFWSFINKVKPFFDEKEFKFLKTKKTFIKNKDKKIRQLIRFEDHGGFFFEITYGIHFKIIEQKLSDLYDVKKSSDSLTIFVNTLNSNISEGDNGFFYVETEGQINSSLEQVRRLCNNTIYPYFDKYSDLESLDDLINNQPLKTRAIGNDFYQNHILDIVFSGLIVAKVLNRPDYENVRIRHIESLKKHFTREESINEFMNTLKKFDETPS